MSRQPLVTIVTPSYNQGHFIRATIESVLAQDYPNIEYIVMDGGSRDNTSEIVAEYQSHLTYFSEKDSGQSEAINKGFRRGKGEILFWINSDDTMMPGATSKAVAALEANPNAGALYGEGFLLDRDGKITQRFPHTVPPNLWRLAFVADYILQQSAYFRRWALDEVGYLGEKLHWTLDWDLFIRIAKKYPLVYLNEDLGCLREYAETKSSAGGVKRAIEIRDVLRKHTGRRYPPGYLLYGADTYRLMYLDLVDRTVPKSLGLLVKTLKFGGNLIAGHIMDWAAHKAQGIYSDGWVRRKAYWMLPQGCGAIEISGSCPDWGHALEGQTLNVRANREDMGTHPVPVGDFRIRIDAGDRFAKSPPELVLTASRSAIPQIFTLDLEVRRLAFRLDDIRWVDTHPA
jgi:glycosyltransferase involved in cell wall biosynthesis